MHFYRALKTVKAITFDLDDTLYDNTECLIQAEAALISAIQQYEPLKDVTLAEHKHDKANLLLEQPEIYHDVINWRVQTIKKMLVQKRVAQEKFNVIIDDVMGQFIEWRHKMIIPDSSFETLALLSEKYPLAVITNGNAEIAKMGLEQYFQFSLRGGEHGRSKPYTDLFHIAASRLSQSAEHILHIGDHPIADVTGAINSGFQACWLNISKQNINQNQEANIVPHMEIIALSEIRNLL